MVAVFLFVLSSASSWLIPLLVSSGEMVSWTSGPTLEVSAPWMFSGLLKSTCMSAIVNN